MSSTAYFRVEWRNAWNDVAVTPWKDSKLPLSLSVMGAYNKLCEWISHVPDRVGFTEAPENGEIRTGTQIGDYSLFQHPHSMRHQYRIVKTGLFSHLEGVMLDAALKASPLPASVETAEAEPEAERQITLPISSQETPR